MNKNKPNLRQFRKFHKNLMAFVKPSFSSWHLRVLFEAADDLLFMNKITKILAEVEKNISASGLENVFVYLRGEIDNLACSIDSYEGIDKKINIALRITTLAGFLEILTEDSVLPDIIINNIKLKYNERYLQVLQDIDKQYLSDDVKNFYSKQVKTNLPQEECLKQYLVLKKWQDLQHKLFVDLIWKYMLPLEGEYMKFMGDAPYFPKVIKYTNQNRATKTRVISRFAKQKLLRLEDLAIFYLAGLGNEIIKLFGGKVAGLVKLKAVGVNVPTTYVCPYTCACLNNEDIKKLPDTLYAIRSSADCEDGEKYSFAGMFDSFLSVDKGRIVDAFDKVKQSMHSDRVKIYINKNKLSKPNMAVIIQEFKDPDYSGVWIGKGKEAGTLEWVEGRGDKLVSGIVSAYREIWSDDCVLTDPLTVNNKSVGKIMIGIQKKISDSYRADFEWCILKNKLVFLQYRPVTASVVSKATDGKKSNDNNVLLGSPASCGIVEGRARFIQDIESDFEFSQGDILITKFTSPEWLPVLVKAGGVVTAYGGLLCHTAIIVRELNIPCVVGVGEENLNKLKTAIHVQVNGEQGTIVIKE